MDEQQPSTVSMIGSFFDMSRGRVSDKILKRRIVEDATIDGIHVMQLIAAMLIASIGLNLNSTEAVIGAMLICPLMGSVIAISYSVATLDRAYLRECCIGLGLQFVVCLLTSTVYFVVSPLSNTTSQLLTNSNPTIWDVIIAFVGGFAGAMGLSRRMEPTTLIAGVAVATALMPPLCSVGFGLATQELLFAAAALYEFLVNVVFIAFGSAIVFVWMRVPINRDLDGDGEVTPEEYDQSEQVVHALRHRLVIGLIVFAVPCVFFSMRTVQQSMVDNGTVFQVMDVYDTEVVTRELEVICPKLTHYRVGLEDSYDTEEDMLRQRVVATVETSVPLSDTAKREAEALIRIHIDNLDSVTFGVAE